MKPLRITYHHNPGLGWYEVRLKDLEKLGIADIITRDSHTDGKGTVFLEEDCDGSTFFDALEFTDWPEPRIDKRHSDTGFIRKLPAYEGGVRADEYLDHFEGDLEDWFGHIGRLGAGEVAPC